MENGQEISLNLVPVKDTMHDYYFSIAPLIKNLWYYGSITYDSKKIAHKEAKKFCKKHGLIIKKIALN